MPSKLSWLKALGLIPTPESVPHGWFTLRQIAKQVGRSRAHVGKGVRKAGLVPRRFKVRVGKRVMSVSHYRLKRKERTG
jgi:predicted transcriptional regulator